MGDWIRELLWQSFQNWFFGLPLGAWVIGTMVITAVIAIRFRWPGVVVLAGLVGFFLGRTGKEDQPSQPPRETSRPERPRPVRDFFKRWRNKK